MSAAASPSALRGVQRAAAVLLALGLATSLSACVDQAEAPTLSPTSSPSETPDAQPSEAPTNSVDVLDLSCADLVDPDVIYAFNPNLALLDDWTPDAGTAAADAVDAGGIACRWVFESGSGSMDIAVARFPEERITELKNEAFGASQMVPTYEADEAYFEVENGAGTAVVFEGRFWMVVTSEAFAEPGEPTDIINSALAALATLPPAP